MTGVCKLLFDLCFYYTLSGYFLYLIFEQRPSGYGIPILILAAILHTALNGQWFSGKNTDGKAGKPIDPKTVILSVLPGAFLAFDLTIWQIIQFLPAWAYFGYSIWSGRVNITRSDFSDRFKFSGKLFLLMIFGVAAFGKIGSAISGIVPYLILYLLTAVCLMRILRDDGKLSAGRNIAVMILLLLGSAALAVLQTPQLILSAAGFIYRNVIVVIILGAMYVIGAVAYGIFSAFRWLFSLFGGGAEDSRPAAEMTVQGAFGDEAEAVLRQTPEWLRILAIALLAAAVAFVVFLILRRMLGGKAREEKTFHTEEQESLKKSGRSAKSAVFRPKDTRQAVRWYYRKYLKEGVSRGAEPVPSDTSLSIQRKYAHFFAAEKPSAETPAASEPGAPEKLRDVYTRSRYCYSREPRKADADEASALWRKLKQRIPGEK